MGNMACVLRKGEARNLTFLRINMKISEHDKARQHETERDKARERERQKDRVKRSVTQ